MLKFFQGKKTFFVAAGFVVYAASGVLIGEMTINEAIPFVLNGTGFAALRIGLKS